MIKKCALERCDNEFDATTSWQKFCCPNCRNKRLYEIERSKIKPTKCRLKSCNNTFKTKNNWQKFCSKECREKCLHETAKSERTAMKGKING